MSIVEITRKIEFDSGHRIPDHASKCKHLHGHRYVLEATLRGPIKDAPGQSDTGMVIDFGDLKGLMQTAVGDEWDHKFLCYDDDPCFIGDWTPFGVIYLPVIPTVENLVNLAAEKLLAVLPKGESTTLSRVRLYETPNCWADWYSESV